MKLKPFSVALACGLSAVVLSVIFESISVIGAMWIAHSKATLLSHIGTSVVHDVSHQLAKFVFPELKFGIFISLTQFLSWFFRGLLIAWIYNFLTRCSSCGPKVCAAAPESEKNGVSSCTSKQCASPQTESVSSEPQK